MPMFNHGSVDLYRQMVLMAGPDRGLGGVRHIL